MGTLRKRQKSKSRYENQLDLFKTLAPDAPPPQTDDVLCQACYHLPRHTVLHLVHLAIMNRRYNKPFNTVDALVNEAINQYLENI